MWALPAVLLDFVAAVLIIISQLPNGEGAAGRGAADCMIKVFHRNAFSDEPISTRGRAVVAGACRDRVS